MLQNVVLWAKRLKISDAGGALTLRQAFSFFMVEQLRGLIDTLKWALEINHLIFRDGFTQSL